jgi:hypothetical protein
MSGATRSKRRSSQKTLKNKKDWIVAIPSYKRAETLKNKTLAVLQKYNIPASKIYIFVANKEEEELYKKTIPATMYNKIIVGVPGLAEVRNFISDYFPIGQKMVCMDDDITGFIEYSEENKRHEIPLRSLIRIINRGFIEAKKHNATLWGIYPVANGYFMKPTVTTKLTNIIGCFWGYINPGSKGEKGISLEMSEKEDYIRAIKAYLRDGVVVRLNFVAPKTAYYKEPGGMQTDPNRLEKHEKAIDYLLKKYPDFVKRSPPRKIGFPEIRIKDSTVKHNK